MKSLKKHCGIHSTNALLVDLHSFTTYTYMVKLLRVFSHCRFQCWKLLMHVNSTRQDGLKIEKKKNCVKLWVQSSFLEIVYKRLEVFLSKKYVDFSLRGMWRRDVPYNCTFFSYFRYLFGGQSSLPRGWVFQWRMQPYITVSTTLYFPHK